MDINLLLKTVLTALIVCSAIMMLVWTWAYRIKNAGVVDIFWAFNFTVIATIIYFMADGFGPRKLLICGLAGLWSIRLGTYLLIRVGAHLGEEEGRYKQLRHEWALNPDRAFFLFFQAQALSNIFLATPFFIIAMNKEPSLSVSEIAGGAMMLVSIIGEGLADWQLKKFKNDPSNKRKVCRHGLWNYSRHPNYFFQLMIWVSVFIMSLSSPWGWVSIICPITSGYLIFKVTGIPMTEEQAIRTKGDAYREYQRTTSVFIPWFRKG